VGKKLIITEKPSVAQDYAKVFQVSGRNNGYIENQDYVITWCVGHLVEMVYPEEYDIRYKRWVLADLPFLPQTYKYGVIKNVHMISFTSFCTDRILIPSTGQATLEKKDRQLKRISVITVV